MINEDMHGNELCTIQEKMLQVKGSIETEGTIGKRLATVSKALISPLSDRWIVKLGNSPELEVEAIILNHECSIVEGRLNNSAEITNKWFRLDDNFDVYVAPL